MAAVDVELPNHARVIMRFPTVCRGSVQHADSARGETIDQVLRRCGGITAKIIPSGAADASAWSGSPAEIFGAELIPGARYLVGYATTPNATKAHVAQLEAGNGVEVLTNEACRLRLETVSGDELGGQAIAAWAQQGNLRIVTDTTTNRWITDLHALLSMRRAIAKNDTAEQSTLGPRVLVCSSARGSGKSIACRILANLAVRHGYHPLLVSASLDGAFPGIASPTSVGVTTIQHALPADDDDASFVPAIQATVGYSVTKPDHLSAADTTTDANDGVTFLAADPAHRATLVHALASALDVAERRTMPFPRARCGGLILDAPPDDGSAEYAQLLLQLMETCEIDVVVFVGGGASLRNSLRYEAFRQRREHADPSAAATASAGKSHRTEGSDLAKQQALEYQIKDAAVVALLGSNHAELHLASGAVIQCFQVPSVAGAVKRLDRDRRAAERLAWRHYFFGTVTTPLQPVADSLTRILLDAKSATPAVRARIALVRLVARSRAALGGMLPLGEEEALGAAADTTFSAQQLDDDELLALLQARGGRAAQASSRDEPGPVAAFFAISAITLRATPTPTGRASVALSAADMSAVAQSPRVIGYAAVAPFGKASGAAAELSSIEWKILTPTPLPLRALDEQETSDGDGTVPVLAMIVLEGAHGGLALR
jgi:hypothetical protein